jgi:hypothetical protein
MLGHGAGICKSGLTEPGRVGNPAYGIRNEYPKRASCQMACTVSNDHFFADPREWTNGPIGKCDQPWEVMGLMAQLLGDSNNCIYPCRQAPQI